MQLAEFHVTGLFGHYNHTIPLPTSPEDSDAPSVVILHGPNGVGKTTVLQMLSGAMSLDFDPFRRVPFKECVLKFNSGVELGVARQDDRSLRVTFKEHVAYLNAQKKGALRDDGIAEVESLRAAFSEYTKDLSFEFLPDTRLSHRVLDQPSTTHFPPSWSPRQIHEYRSIQLSVTNDLIVGDAPRSSLAERVQRFTREAQVDYRSFFGTTEPDLFPRIIENLSNPHSALEQPEVLEKKLNRLNALDETHSRLGLGRDRWDYAQLLASVQMVQKQRGAQNDYALIVLNTYIESLESRADARELIAERLLNFEEIMLEFFKDKRVKISGKTGIEITSSRGQVLNESQLSSGEYQLLYLMVAALTTKRRGTVIAIDEPELSMHPAWTRRLVRNILRCASRATPQLILATHSIDIATDYSERLVMLSADDAY